MKNFARKRMIQRAIRAQVGLTAASGFLVGLTFALLLWSLVAPSSLATVIADRAAFPVAGLDDWQVQAIAGIILVLFGLWLQALADLRELAALSGDPGFPFMPLVRQTRRRAIGFALSALVWSLLGQLPVSVIATIGDPLGRSSMSLQIGLLTLVSAALVGITLFAFRTQFEADRSQVRHRSILSSRQD